MRLYKRTLKIVGPLTFVFLLLVVVFSILQCEFQTSNIFCIINNMCICILTSGILICIQSIISFYSARKEAVLSFYKETLMFEKKLCDYPSINHGFIVAKDGLLQVLELTSNFSDRLRWSYMQIDISNKRSKIIKTIISLFKIYQIQICEFDKMEYLLKKTIEFLDTPEKDLINKGIDIELETVSFNQKLQNQEAEVEKAFNDVKNNQLRNMYLDIIEEFLFCDSYNIKKS